MKLTGLLLALTATAGAVGTPLLLTPLVNAGKLQEARDQSKITALGGVDNMGHSGFFTVPSTMKTQNNNMFFWFMPCTDGCDKDAPMVLWMQGGPGGPSTFGMLEEVGSFYPDADGKLNDRCFSWCKKNNCIIVDQPVMTGLSFPTNSSGEFDPDNIEYTRTSPDATEQVYQVLAQFYKVWPEYSTNPFYVSGESYGGNYCAWMSATIVKHNQMLPPNDPAIIPLVGVAVGDPVLNWKYQYPTYPDTLYGMGVIMETERDSLRTLFKTAVEQLETDCVASFDSWNSVWNDDGGGGAPGLYFEYTGSSNTENVLLSREPKVFDYYGDFLAMNETAKAMHFEGDPAGSVAEGGLVYSTMVESGDFCANSSHVYAQLFLAVGIDVMIYSGTSDALLGPPCTEAGINAMFDYGTSLPGGTEAKAAFAAAKKTIWKASADKDEDVSGYAKCIPGPHDNRFCFVVVRNAGHEVITFQPRTSYDMIQRFIENRSFGPDGIAPLPTCAQCGGAPPFAGGALPECVCG